MCFYILNSPRSDKIKIGISSDFSKRFNQYRQHNPDIAIYRVYGCDMNTARLIETETKERFKDFAIDNSTEWLIINPYIVDSFVLPKIVEYGKEIKNAPVKASSDNSESRDIFNSWVKEVGLSYDPSELRMTEKKLIFDSFLEWKSDNGFSVFVSVERFWLSIQNIFKFEGYMPREIKRGPRGAQIRVVPFYFPSA